MIHAKQALKLSSDMKGFVELITTRIFEAAMKGQREAHLGNDYNDEQKDYGPEMKAYGAGCYQNTEKPEITENVFRDMLKAHGYDVHWSQSGITIKW